VGGVKNLTDENLYTVESGYFGKGVLQQPREFYLSASYKFW
jgi:outer membrane receptor protein involved in Fe transport